MDKDLATIVLATAIRTSSEIGNLAQLPVSSDEDLKFGIGTSVFYIKENIIDPLLDKFPELKAEMDTRMSRYGRYI